MGEREPTGYPPIRRINAKLWSPVTLPDGKGDILEKPLNALKTNDDKRSEDEKKEVKNNQK